MSGEHDALMFGRNLCLIRRRRGFSQERLAWRAGLSRDTIHKLETGKRSPRLGTILILADTLGVDPGEFLKGLRA
jgi:transcriptional regulator with XRE-family HTH domain